MSHVLQATYEDGVLKLEHRLPLAEHEQVQVTVERLTASRHSVLDIPEVSLGKVLRPLAADDDLLGEMLEGH
jgi:predicted DNA-binding antitoxin AbrB/MazE fold protein